MEGEKDMEVRYYICKHCGNIVEKVKDKGVPVICCGEPMQELKAGVTDAAVEKHVPVYTIEGSHVHVVVGETKHPMKEELSIDIIGLAGACSYALDCIEAELVNIKNKHGKRVAYISIRMAEY